MKESLKHKADAMIAINQQLKSKYKWKANDVSLRFAATVFALRDTPFNLKRYDQIVKHIKSSVGMFSHHRANLLYPIAAQLAAHSQPEQDFDKLLTYEKAMKTSGFKSTSYLGIAAYALLTTTEEYAIQAVIDKAKAIHEGMKAKHRWLTTADDYPVAVLLAGDDRLVAELINDMEAHYSQLHKVGFKRSNGLQSLSHMLTFGNESVELKVARCQELADKFKDHKLGVSSMYYATIGLLALLGDESEAAFREVLELVDYLKSQKAFKWHSKGINTLIVSALVGNECVESVKQGIGATSLSITIEALLQAQSAAMIAAISAASASAAVQ